MSRETTLILLGLFIMALRTVLGFPGAWQTAMLVVAGGAVAMIGFLLRGERLARGRQPTHHDSFVEARPHAETTHPHEHKEGITSLN